VDNISGSILIVDDDPGFRELVSVLCARAGYACVEAGSREEALTEASRVRPDAVLLDVMLGETSGFQVCRELRSAFGEQLPIIFLSGERADAHDRVAGLLLGADDYVTKPIEPDELLARVQRAVTRSTSSQDRSSNGANGAATRLTPRERGVLTLLAQGLGTEQIAERLYISPKTVSTHVQRMLAKLHIHSRAEAVAFAYREGLVEDVSAHAFAVSGRKRSARVQPHGSHDLSSVREQSPLV
jgi:DNA-binding NarL/FixJ family response regulator